MYWNFMRFQVSGPLRNLKFHEISVDFRNLKSSQWNFRTIVPFTCTVLEVYNLQGGVLGFSHERSGLGMVLSVSINSAPSKGPDTTLVPWKLTRMVAGTQYPWDLTATSYIPPPLAPPDRHDSQSQNFWTWFARKVSKYAPESPVREELESGLKATNVL